MYPSRLIDFCTRFRVAAATDGTSRMTSETVAGTLREVFTAQVAPALNAVVPDHPRERAALAGALIMGLATTRYALRAPGVAAMSPAELTAWAAPVLEQVLTGPAPVDAG